MPADQPPAARSAAPSADRLRRRGMRVAVLFAAVALTLLGVGAWVLATSQSRDREQLRDRYATGATVASALIDSLFRVAFTSGIERASEQFSGEVSARQLDGYATRNQNLYAAILEADGTVVARSAKAPPDAGRAVARAARRTGFAVGDVTQVGAAEAVESATRFPSGATMRYLIAASAKEVYVEFLSGSIAPLVRYGGEGFVLDGAGRVLGAVSADHPERPPPPSPTLRDRAARQDRGVYTTDGDERFFASTDVPNTGWQVVVSIRTSELYAPASGISRWLPWVVLGILGLALLAIGALIRRAVIGGARIAAAHAQLAASQDRLRDRAVELQASNAELQRSNAELEQFAYVASHDLSAPLRAVAGFSQLLGVRYRGRLDEEADEFIGHMQDGVDRMQRIIDDLLAYSRVDRSGLRAQAIDLDAILDEALQSLRADVEARGAQVTREPLGTACGEPGQLSQVLQNLIANGLKFTAPGVAPEIHLSARREGERVFVSVRDNGIGIDPGHVEQIFKMFQRLHSTDDYDGTGIGLAIARKIVERHDGDITVAPAPGGGSVFTFDVPAREPDA